MSDQSKSKPGSKPGSKPKTWQVTQYTIMRVFPAELGVWMAHFGKGGEAAAPEDREPVIMWALCSVRVTLYRQGAEKYGRLKDGTKDYPPQIYPMCWCGDGGRMVVAPEEWSDYAGVFPSRRNPLFRWQDQPVDPPVAPPVDPPVEKSDGDTNAGP